MRRIGEGGAEQSVSRSDSRLRDRDGLSHLNMADLREIPSFLGALRRARLRSLRGRVEKRVLGSDSCKGPNSADWTCTVCGTVTFGSKKTDQCFHCKTVRKRSGK